MAVQAVYVDVEYWLIIWLVYNTNFCIFSAIFTRFWILRNKTSYKYIYLHVPYIYILYMYKCTGINIGIRNFWCGLLIYFLPKYCIFYLFLPLPFRKSTIHLFVNFNLYRCRSKFWYWTRWCWFRSTWSRTGKISKTHKMRKHCYFAFISGAYWLSILSHEVKYPISPSVVSCVKCSGHFCCTC